MDRHALDIIHHETFLQLSAVRKKILAYGSQYNKTIQGGLLISLWLYKDNKLRV
jgi:hypothetical protein